MCRLMQSLLKREDAKKNIFIYEQKKTLYEKEVEKLQTYTYKIIF